MSIKDRLSAKFKRVEDSFFANNSEEIAEFLAKVVEFHKIDVSGFVLLSQPMEVGNEDDGSPRFESNYTIDAGFALGESDTIPINLLPPGITSPQVLSYKTSDYDSVDDAKFVILHELGHVIQYTTNLLTNTLQGIQWNKPGEEEFFGLFEIGLKTSHDSTYFRLPWEKDANAFAFGSKFCPPKSSFKDRQIKYLLRLVEADYPADRDNDTLNFLKSVVNLLTSMEEREVN